MARPKKPEGERQAHVAAFRLTESEYKAFAELSAETHLTKSQLGRFAAIGMKQVYISDELIEEARNLSRQLSQVGNLLRLHATLLEVIVPNPSLTPGDRAEIYRIRELLEQSETELRELRKSVTELRREVRELIHGNL